MVRFTFRSAVFTLTAGACLLAFAGCGLPRHVAARPDYDLPMGFSGTYRLGLVQAGEVPAGPTDREAFDRLDVGPRRTPAGPFAEPLPITPSLDHAFDAETGTPPGLPAPYQPVPGPFAAPATGEPAGAEPIGGPLARLERL